MMHLYPHWGPEDPSGVQLSLYVSLSVCLSFCISVSQSLQLYVSLSGRLIHFLGIKARGP